MFNAVFSCPTFQVLVEFDDLSWDKREWISIYKDGFNLFLLEENLVLAQRSTPPPKGNMHPALVRILLSITSFSPKVDRKTVY